MNKSFLIVISFLSLASIEAQNLDWWKTAVFYQIYPRSFKDSNNDGIGDLQGIIDKLPHLKDAGVTAAWLSPIYASPQVDAGYDISNFTDVNPDYGTLEDFDRLVARAKELGLKVVMDFVPNHSSDQHLWFTMSENREPGYEDYYTWMDAAADGGPPNNWISVFKYSAWEWSEIRQQYYLHQFAVQQPDLNYSSPALAQEMKDVLTFWLDRGIDGFRIDAIPHLFEDPGFPDEPPTNSGAEPWEWESLDHIYTKDQPLTYDMVYQWRTLVDEYTATHGGDTRVLMTESYTTLEKTMLYYGDGQREGAHFSFNFQLITTVNGDSTAQDFVKAVEDWMTAMPDQYTANWVLGNHDQHRLATRYGIGNVDGLNMLMALLPGVGVTYNGEEIGMENGEVTWEQGQDPGACNGPPEDFDKISRDFQRTPFHWDNSTNGGFNEGAQTWLPVSSKYTTNNLASQSVEGVKSHYHIYQQLMQLRQNEVLKNGSYQIVALANEVLGLYRKVQGNPGYILIMNKGIEAITIDVNAGISGISQQLEVVIASLSSTREPGDSLVANSVELGAFEAFVVVEL